MIKGIITFLGGIVGLAQNFLTAKEREKDREAGRNEEKVKGFQNAEDTQKRIDAVERPDDNDVVDILRKGEF